MKKYALLNVAFFAFVTLVALSSCSSPKKVVLPTAINTVKSVTLSEMNLDREDYQVLNRISAEASILYKETNGAIKITTDSGEGELTYAKTETGLVLRKFKGFFKMGYLENDYGNVNYNNPEEFARRLAIYRLINAANEMGADGIIEPIISTNVAEEGKNTVVFKTTVSGKVIKLKTNK